MTRTLLFLLSFLQLTFACDNLHYWSAYELLNDYHAFPNWNPSLPSTSHHQTQTDTKTCIQSYDELAQCDKVESPSGSAVLTLQPDGNLVLYWPFSMNPFCNWGGKCLRPVWSTQTNKPNGPKTLRVGSGSASIIDGTGKEVWTTKTTKGTQLCVQDDGNVVLYTAGMEAVWQSGTRMDR
ncbi:hypothetical protein HDU79_007934 [Rhizoclosmatium sp. JEL0117]|nr:hypothetical protein HDU79_007934 [Rhizoclosmatium sp. JEL0117]